MSDNDTAVLIGSMIEGRLEGHNSFNQGSKKTGSRYSNGCKTRARGRCRLKHQEPTSHEVGIKLIATRVNRYERPVNRYSLIALAALFPSPIARITVDP